MGQLKDYFQWKRENANDDNGFYEAPIIGDIKCEHSPAFNKMKLYDFILHQSAEPLFGVGTRQRKPQLWKRSTTELCILESGRSRGLEE